MDDAERVGLYFDFTTGAVLASENFATAFGVGLWLFGIVLGLATAWLVMP